MRVRLIAAAIAALLVVAGGASAASSEVVVRGTFLVADADAHDGADANLYLLKTSTGYLDLHFARAPALQPNQRVLVTGDQQGNEISVSRVEATGAAAPPAQASGTLHALVMLVSWPSVPPDLVTPAQAEAQVGSTDDTWYEDVSYGRIGMAATAIDRNNFFRRCITGLFSHLRTGS